MISRTISTVLVTAIVAIDGGRSAASFQTGQPAATRTSDLTGRPLLLEQNEGDLRTRRKNIGAEPIALTFIFSAPGFEETMRCNSVPAGDTPTAITPEEQLACAHLGHAESAGRQDKPKK